MQMPVNTKMPLSLQNPDGVTNLFPVAHVFKGDVEVSGSPFSLTHRGFGLYRNDSFIPDDEDNYYATYINYTDGGHTSESSNYGRASDIFQVVASNGLSQADFLKFIQLVPPLRGLINGNNPNAVPTRFAKGQDYQLNIQVLLDASGQPLPMPTDEVTALSLFLPAAAGGSLEYSLVNSKARIVSEDNGLLQFDISKDDALLVAPDQSFWIQFTKSGVRTKMRFDNNLTITPDDPTAS